MEKYNIYAAVPRVRVLVPCPVETGDPKDGYSEAETLYRIRTNFQQRQDRSCRGEGFLTDEEATWLLEQMEGAAEKIGELKDKVQEVESELEDEREERESIEGKLKTVKAVVQRI